jgi:hypothetical protein
MNTVFNMKFFIAALLLDLTSGLINSFLSLWMHFAFPGLSPSFITWFSLAFAPVSFALSIALPFAVMYLLTTRHSGPQINPVIVSTFLGCWIGEASTLTLNILINYLLGGSHDLLLPVFYILWGLFAAAFSATLFITLTAILLANYSKTTTHTPIPSKTETTATTTPQ